MTPDQVIETLKEDASPRKQKTLDRIYELCLDLEARGIRDFSLATIARFGRGRGVPSSQSLRNRTGESYRVLIKAFQARNQSQPRRRRRAHEAWIDELKSERHRFLANKQAAELTALKEKLATLHPAGSLIEIRDYHHSDSPDDARLTNLERRSLNYLISDDFLGRWNFKVTEYGEVVDTSGNKVFKAGTIDAIKKALEAL